MDLRRVHPIQCSMQGALITDPALRDMLKHQVGGGDDLSRQSSWAETVYFLIGSQHLRELGSYCRLEEDSNHDAEARLAI